MSSLGRLSACVLVGGLVGLSAARASATPAPAPVAGAADGARDPRRDTAARDTAARGRRTATPTVRQAHAGARGAIVAADDPGALEARGLIVLETLLRPARDGVRPPGAAVGSGAAMGSGAAVGSSAAVGSRRGPVETRGLFLVRTPLTDDPEQVAETARRVGLVDVSPNLPLERRPQATDGPPNDPLYGGQWYLDRIQIEDAWRVTTGTSAITVVVIDNGCDATHPDLRGKLDPGLDVVDGDDDPSPGGSGRGDNHGTACASIVGAQTDDDIGMAGACPECRLRCVRMLSDGPVGADADVRAMGFALDVGAAVVSNSWGFRRATQVPRALGVAIRALTTRGRDGLGAVVVFAAGNDDRALGAGELYDIDGVVTVGALTLFDEAAPFSNFGAALDVTAPAGTLAADLVGPAGDAPGDYTDLFGGTSAAAPVVAGVFGLLASYAPDAPAETLIAAALESTRRAPFARPDDRGHDPTYGFGIIAPGPALARLGAVPVLDAGVGPDLGAAPDATEPRDAGIAPDASAQVDAGAAPEPAGEGCGCRSVTGSDATWPGAAAFAAAWVVRRRRRR
jgi:serine protease